MERLLLIAFASIGVLMIVFRRRLIEAFAASNRAFLASLIGEDRTERFERSRWGRFHRAYGRVFVLIFGIAWTAICLVGLLGPLFGRDE
jgi:hypothetical protein